MTLEVGDALERGFRRTTARNGLLLVAVVYVLNVLNGAFGPEATRLEFPQGSVAVTPDPLVAVPWVVDGLLGLVVLVGGLLVTLAALRTFVGDDIETLPEDAFTRNAGAALLNLFVGGVLFAIAVAVGLVLLILPGVFLLVTLIFWDVFVAVEDASFVEGFRESWRLTEGHRLSLVLLGVGYLLVAFVVSLAFSIASAPLGDLGVFVGALGNAANTVYAYATLAAAYVQLRDSDDREGDGTGGDDGAVDGNGDDDGAVPA